MRSVCNLIRLFKSVLIVILFISILSACVYTVEDPGNLLGEGDKVYLQLYEHGYGDESYKVAEGQKGKDAGKVTWNFDRKFHSGFITDEIVSWLPEYSTSIIYAGSIGENESLITITLTDDPSEWGKPTIPALGVKVKSIVKHEPTIYEVTLEVFGEGGVPVDGRTSIFVKSDQAKIFDPDVDTNKTSIPYLNGADGITVNGEVTFKMDNGPSQTLVFDVYNGLKKLESFNISLDFPGGIGTEDDPYLIETEEHLDAMRDDLMAHYKLNADIDLTEYLAEGGAGYNGGAGWLPIGSYTNKFKGTFDGDGHTITGLTINRSTDNVGLFSSTDSNVVIENVHLVNAIVIGGDHNSAVLVGDNSGSIMNSHVTGEVEGNNSVGGLVGYNDGSISYSSASGKVKGEDYVGGLVGESYGSITNSFATAEVIGGFDVGGLVGYSEDFIQNSYATGDVFGDDCVGGLVGYNYGGEITNSVAKGNVTGEINVGGLVGTNSSLIIESSATGAVTGNAGIGGLVGANESGGIEQSFATGEIIGLEGMVILDVSSPIAVGGLVGVSAAPITNSYATGVVQGNLATGGLVGLNLAEITNSYAIGKVSGEADSTGGLIGTNDGRLINSEFYGKVSYSYYDMVSTGQSTEVVGRGVGKTTTEMKQQDTFESWDFDDIWAIDDEHNNGYPYLLNSKLLVVYDGNGNTSGSVPSEAQLYAMDSTVTVLGNTGNFAKSGFSFAGWNTQADGKGTNYKAGESLKLTEHVTLYAKWTDNNSGGGGYVPPVEPPKPKEGSLTLPAGSAGKSSLEDAIVIDIPAGATSQELKLTIEKVVEIQNIVSDNEQLVSEVYEVLKNFTENFHIPIKISIQFDPAKLKADQTVAIYYYDEDKQEWVEVEGGVVDGNRISVDVDHFTKFAVFAVNKKPAVSFSDIAGHWAEADILQAANAGIVNGYLDGTFKPNRTVTRAEFAVMLMNTLKLDGMGTELAFTDSAMIGVWAQQAIELAVQAGIIHGYVDGTFRPDAEITRSEMAAMLTNTLVHTKYTNTSTGFADDQDIPAWVKHGVALLKELGIVTGKDGNRFDPYAKMTRAEAVRVLLKLQAYKSK